MELAAALEAALREFAADPALEVRENGGQATPLTELSWEIRGAAAKPLLRLRSGERSITRRILGIAEHSSRRLVLRVERFGRHKACRIEFVRGKFRRSDREVSRAGFRERFRRILAEQFPDEELESLTVASDLEHSLSENYVRGLLRRGSSHWAVLGVPTGEASNAIENSLTFALLWFERSRQVSRSGVPAGIRLIVPKGGAQLIAQRACALRADLPLELYEHDCASETFARIEPRTAGNIASWIVPRRETEALLDCARRELDGIVAMAPQAIDLHPVAASREIWLRFRGLAFGYWKEGRVFYGLNKPWKELAPHALHELQNLLRDLETFRHPLGTDTRHPLYRAQAERWLESLVGEDVSRIDACLNPRFVYRQIFANAGGEHGILDLLAVTRGGRLAILELKASEHLHLPLQAAGYWRQVRHHAEGGELSRYGYFSGVELQSRPPIVYLVAPALHFHSATDTLLRYVSPEMEVVRIGLHENWRRGVRVSMRQ